MDDFTTKTGKTLVLIVNSALADEAKVKELVSALKEAVNGG